MSIRTFIFCDICNRSGIRQLEQRRGPNRSASHGRRITDGRAWFEGSVTEAQQAGWIIDEHDRHICKRCHDRGLHQR